MNEGLDTSGEILGEGLPADRRLRLYLGIARRLRPNPDARGVRRAAVEMAWQARQDLRALEQEQRDPLVIQLIGGVPGIENYPEMAALIGGYVARYEPSAAPRGEQWLWVTSDVEQALTFDSLVELHEFYSQSIGTRPWDGKPDRPLTAFHITVVRKSRTGAA